MKTLRKDGVSLVEHIEALGDENKFDQQAQDFLAETDTSYEVRYIGLIKHFPNDEEKRDQWEIKLSRKGRKYIFKYGASLQDTWNRLSKYINGAEGERTAKYLLNLWENSPNTSWGQTGECRMSKMKHEKFAEEMKGWTTGAHIHAPTAYNILACMQAHEPPTTFDDFIAEYGYEITGKESYETALKTFGAVAEEWTSLCTLYNNDEMKALSRIS